MLKDVLLHQRGGTSSGVCYIASQCLRGKESMCKTYASKLCNYSHQNEQSKTSSTTKCLPRDTPPSIILHLHWVPQWLLGLEGTSVVDNIHSWHWGCCGHDIYATDVSPLSQKEVRLPQPLSVLPSSRLELLRRDLPCATTKLIVVVNAPDKETLCFTLTAA
jgi:hypothetical protein